MKKYLLTLTAVLCCAMTTMVLTSCSGNYDNPVDPEPVPSLTPFGDLLGQVDNVASIEAFTPTYNNAGHTECYKVFFDQPIDHENPSAGTMKQKALIYFKGFDRPTVMYTCGYSLPDTWKDWMCNLDIAANMDANIIGVEHRYFGESKNLEDTRWDYLTIEQAAADHHAIFEPLKKILPKEWISTGTSKDGMTSLFFRYFYPNDITVTTVFCSPLMTSLYYMPVGTYLDNESGPSTRTTSPPATPASGAARRCGCPRRSTRTTAPSGTPTAMPSRMPRASATGSGGSSTGTASLSGT